MTRRRPTISSEVLVAACTAPTEQQRRTRKEEIDEELTRLYYQQTEVERALVHIHEVQ